MLVIFVTIKQKEGRPRRARHVCYTNKFIPWVFQPVCCIYVMVSIKESGTKQVVGFASKISVLIKIGDPSGSLRISKHYSTKNLASQCVTASSSHFIIALIEVAIRLTKEDPKLHNCEPGPALVSAH